MGKGMNQQHGGMGGMGSTDGFMQMIQMQMLSMASLKNDGNMMTMIFGFVIMMLMNNIMKIIPMIITMVEKYTNKYIENKKEQYMEKVKTIINDKGEIKTRKGTILFEKVENNQSDEILLSLIKYMSNLKNSEFVLFNNDYYVINKKEFVLEPEIYCCVLSYEKDDKTGKIVKYSFEIYSYVYNIEKLKDFADRIVDEYVKDKDNKLGKQPHYFNQINIPIPKNMDGTYRYDTAFKQLVFDMIPFYTNKSLKNVFGTHLDIVKKRMDMFINNPLWYQNKGIPHTLGILLSGPPGTGKTSVIKAIASDTGRHIFNLTLNKMTTQTQLKNLFYSNEIKVLNNGCNESLYIPIDKRIYVIEDIDALGDIVLDRNIKKKLHKLEQNKSTEINNLSNILNNNNNGINPFIMPLKKTKNTQVINKMKEESREMLNRHMNEHKFLDETMNGNDNDNGNFASFDNIEPFMDDPSVSGGIENMFNVGIINNGNGNGNGIPLQFSNDNSSIQKSEENNENIEEKLKHLHKYSPKELKPEDLEYITNSIKNNNNSNNSNPLPFSNNNNSNSSTNSNRSSNSDEKSISSLSDFKKEDKEKEDTNPEEITLSFLLNLLDGVLETPGRIIIMTTNHPDLLDPALIRPGRIDINLRVGNCSRDMIIKMIRYFYEDETLEVTDEWKYNKEISPAKVSSILQNNFDNYKSAIQELIECTN